MQADATRACSRTGGDDGKVRPVPRRCWRRWPRSSRSGPRFRPAAQDDPLPSWNDGAAKQAILDFVTATTTEGGAGFVAPEDRIATFDQDGTTWVEQPLYGQGLFALDRLAEMAPDHPEWKETEPFKSVLTGDHAAMAKFTEKDWMEIVAVTHAGMSIDRLRGARRRLAAEVDRPVLRAAGHRAHLPADARGDGLPARQRLPHLHRHRRRPGVRPRLFRGRLRRPARAGGRLQHRDQVRDAGRQAGADARAEGRSSSTTAPARRVGIDLFIGKRPQIAFGNSNGDQRDAAMGHRRRRRPASASSSCTTTPSASSPTAPPTACPTATSAPSARR